MSCTTCRRATAPARSPGKPGPAAIPSPRRTGAAVFALRRGRRTVVLDPVCLALFVDRRLPEMGALVPLGPATLGTATIYLPATEETARFDVRGLTAGQARLAGARSTPVMKDRQVAVTIVLDAQPLPDKDTDGV